MSLAFRRHIRHSVNLSSWRAKPRSIEFQQRSFVWFQMLVSCQKPTTQASFSSNCGAVLQVSDGILDVYRVEHGEVPTALCNERIQAKDALERHKIFTLSSYRLIITRCINSYSQVLATLEYLLPIEMSLYQRQCHQTRVQEPAGSPCLS